MTPKPAASLVTPNQRNQLVRCQGNCGRVATKASGRVWCYWCDPSTSQEEKLAARQLGGRRGLMGPAEAAVLLEGADIATPEGRNALRLRLAQVRASGVLGSAMMRDLLAVVDGAAKDQPKAVMSPRAPLVVEVQRFAPNGTEATEKP